MSDDFDLKKALGIDEPEETEEKGQHNVEEKLLTQDHLESILFQFVNLYDRWSEDRQVAAKQGADIAKFVKQFSQQVSHFELLEERVRGNIQKSIHEETKKIASYVAGSIEDAATKEIEPTIRTLKQAVYDNGHLLQRYNSAFDFTHWKIIGITAFSSILASLLIVWLLIPKPTLLLTSQQTRYLVTGESFTEIWPKLSKAEKEHFKKLAEDNGMMIHS